MSAPFLLINRYIFPLKRHFVCLGEHLCSVPQLQVLCSILVLRVHLLYLYLFVRSQILSTVLGEIFRVNRYIVKSKQILKI